MSKYLKIYCVNTEEYLKISGGDTLTDILKLVEHKLPFAPICAKVNNRTEALSFQVFMPKQIEFLAPDNPSSRRVYTRSLCFMLYKAVNEVHPNMALRIEHSVSHGYYCRLHPQDDPQVTVSPDVPRLLEVMRQLCRANLPIERHERLTKDVMELFRRQHLNSKVELLETTHELYTTYYTLGDLADSYYGPLAPSTGMIDIFDLQPYSEGMLLLPPNHLMDAPATPVEQRKMFDAFTDYLRFNHVIGVDNVGQLNRAIEQQRSSQLINLAETLHANELSRIAGRIAESGAKVVLLAGPSSSGKTTTCKRLSIHLMANLLKPKMISLDDYFVDRHTTPIDPVTGDYDYESLYALDLPLFNRHLNALLAGEEVNLPTYSFELGQRIEKARPLKLEKDDILLIEGIHGLNPNLTPEVPSDKIFKVYVSALTTLSIDDHNWIPTTDTRLLRRLVRDHKYRNTGALETLKRWTSVRRGEELWIFPFQENADATFNSSLLFEPAVLREYAEPLLKGVPHDVEQYSEAHRLLKFLSYFTPLRSDQIPSTSLLREFLGGSSFHY
ncbi:MAG: nucleoside kinase [Muribaculaceae bacterium]|nr:nucleoside kinase [Muribaculaceae bacterium]